MASPVSGLAVKYASGFVRAFIGETLVDQVQQRTGIKTYTPPPTKLFEAAAAVAYPVVKAQTGFGKVPETQQGSWNPLTGFGQRAGQSFVSLNPVYGYAKLTQHVLGPQNTHATINNFVSRMESHL